MSQAHIVPRQDTVVETLQLFSHDIRSAMSDVIGGLRLVDLSELSVETRMQFDRIQAAGDTLAALVDAALMAAAGETRIQLAESETVLADWLTALDNRWSGRAQECDSRFSLALPDRLPDAILLAPVTLDRILGNLIGNALNHAAGSPVMLELMAPKGAGLILSVRDGGPGYPESVLAEVMERGEAAPTGAQAGSGLGLRIVAELSRQIGGRIDLANSDAGGGIANLHVPEQLIVWDRGAVAPCLPPDLSGLKLLVAEDNLTNQTILKQLLQRMGAEAKFVADGVAALDILEREAFDLALIDIEMPRKNGLEVMRAVRAGSGDAATMPLVALTAYVLRDNREAIYAAGADGIIGKPIASGGEFGRAILRHVGRSDGLPGADELLGGGVGSIEMGAQLDRSQFDALLDIAGEDGRVELLSRLIEDIGAVRDKLDQAVTSEDTAEIRAQSHILIAISGAVGADRLTRLAEVLNIAAKRNRVDELAGLYAPCRSDLSDLLQVVRAEAKPS